MPILASLFAQIRPAFDRAILTLALGLAVSSQMPSAAVAQQGNIARVIFCALNASAPECQPARPAPATPAPDTTATPAARAPANTGGGGGNSGGGGWGGDAVYLDQTGATWIQGALDNLGLYTGAIDGALDGETREAIRAYQGEIGAPQSGRLSAIQINDLAGLAPAFAGLASNDPARMGADLANDLAYDEISQLQAALLQNGFNAGPVDGQMGGMTRTAITGYKQANGLPGAPVASRRLLAHMMGWTPPAPAGVALARVKPAPPMAGTGAGAVAAAMPAGDSPEAPAAAPVAPPMTFDLKGIRLGMTETEAAGLLDRVLGTTRMVEMGPARVFGGNETLSSATLSIGQAWPNPNAEQIVTFRDKMRPELGVLAAFHLIRLRDGTERAGFVADVLPGIVARLGPAGRVGETLVWIGDAEARAAATDDPARLAACGALRIGEMDHTLLAHRSVWSVGGGLVLDGESLAGVGADCGEVLRVDFDGDVVRIGLWNSSVLSQ